MGQDGKKYKTFSWHHGDATVIHLWCILGTYMPIVAIYQTLATKLQLTKHSYNLGWNLIFFGPFLIVTLWRLGEAYQVPILHILPCVYSVFLALFYYIFQKKGMYFESLLLSFLVLVTGIPLWKRLPKMQNRTRRRLPDLIKEQVEKQTIK
jgi:hypothetical protein